MFNLLSVNVFLAVRAEGRQSFAFIESSWRCNYFKRMLLRHLEVIFYGFYYGKSPSFTTILDKIFGCFSLSLSNPSSWKADIKKIYLKHPWDWYICLDLPKKSTIHVGKYASPMDGMGTREPSNKKKPRGVLNLFQGENVFKAPHHQKTNLRRCLFGCTCLPQPPRMVFGCIGMDCLYLAFGFADQMCLRITFWIWFHGGLHSSFVLI